MSALSWTGTTLSTGARGGLVCSYDIRSRAPVIQMAGHTQEVCGLAWSPDGKYLASGGNDNVVNVWDAAGSNTRSFTDHCAAVLGIMLDKNEFVDCGGYRTVSAKGTYSFYKQVVLACRDLRSILERGRHCKANLKGKKVCEITSISSDEASVG